MSNPPESALEARLSALEASVRELTREREAREAPAGLAPAAGEAGDDRFWMLTELRRRHPDGAVGFAGHVPLPGGEAGWQWGRGTDDLLEQEWDDAATPLAALGHPARLHLLRLVLAGTDTTADLAADESLGSTGRLHHHLRTLVAAGWLASAGRGRYEVPAHRVVPLLTIVAAILPAP